MRGASLHLRPVTDPAAAAVHNGRQWTAEHAAPRYLLPPEHSLGHWSEITGDIVAAHSAKMALASRQARQAKAYSPLWEGVINLPDPTGRGDRSRLGAMVRQIIDGYQRITGHKVISADIHLDEGRIDPGGLPIYNSHAHIVVDRTDERGRAVLLNRTQLREIQDLVADATGLFRGRPAAETGLKHLAHQAYRALARTGRLKSQREIEADGEMAAEAVRAAAKKAKAAEARRAAEAAKAAQAAAEATKTTAELYGEVRGLLKTSGRAKQADYQEAKRFREDRAWLEARIAELTAAAADERAAFAPIAAAAMPPIRRQIAEATAAGDWGTAGDLTYRVLATAESLAGDLAPPPGSADQPARPEADRRWQQAVAAVAGQCLATADIAHQALWAVRQIIQTAGEPIPPALETRYQAARAQQSGRGR